jgi:hypothetical protein
MLGLFACLALTAVSFARAQAPAAQKPAAWPEDMKKLYQEIAGNYLFEVQGQSTVLSFYEKDGVLFGVQDDSEPIENKPVKDKPLHFEAVGSGGNLIEMQFVRDDKGVIAKLIVSSQGGSFEGAKEIKK